MKFILVLSALIAVNVTTSNLSSAKVLKVIPCDEDSEGNCIGDPAPAPTE